MIVVRMNAVVILRYPYRATSFETLCCINSGNSDLLSVAVVAVPATWSSSADADDAEGCTVADVKAIPSAGVAARDSVSVQVGRILLRGGDGITATNVLLLLLLGWPHLFFYYCKVPFVDDVRSTRRFVK